MSSNSASCEGAMAEKEENMRRGPWTVEEDMGLIRCVSVQGEGRWNTIAKLAGLKRTGKSCRLRWLNYLRPDVKRGNITPEEQLLILNLHRRWGNRWSKIAQQLPGRTDNEIKNYWRTRIKKQLQKLECAGVNSSKLFEDSARNSWIPTLYHSYVDCTANQTASSAPASSAQSFQGIRNQYKPIGGENLHDGSAFHDQTYFNHGDQLSNAVGLGDEYCMDVSPSSNLEVNTHALASSQLPNNISSSSDTDISQSQQGNEADEALALAGAPSTFANSSEIKPSSYNYAISDVEIMWPFEFDQYSLWNMEEIHQHAYNA